MEWIAFDMIVLLCVLIFMGMGVWALIRKTPMHFWSGTTVKPETITDIKNIIKRMRSCGFATVFR